MSIDLANQIVTGLLTGLVYSLMALGLSVIFGVVRVVNFAHGEMTALAMYAAWGLATYLDLDPLSGTFGIEIEGKHANWRIARAGEKSRL